MTQPDDDALIAPTPPAVPANVRVPLDVYKAIERVAEREQSDPFVARRLAAWYKQGLWVPADDQRSKS